MGLVAVVRLVNGLENEKPRGLSQPGQVSFPGLGDGAYLYTLCRCGQQQGTEILGTRPEMFIFMAHVHPQHAKTCSNCTHPGNCISVTTALLRACYWGGLESSSNVNGEMKWDLICCSLRLFIKCHLPISHQHGVEILPAGHWLVGRSTEEPQIWQKPENHQSYIVRLRSIKKQSQC